MSGSVGGLIGVVNGRLRDYARAMDDEELKKRTVEKAYTERRGPAGKVVGLDLGLSSGRVVERRRRCGNCQWFDTEEAFEMHFQRCLVRDGKVLRDRGATQPVIKAQADRLRKVILEKKGEVGFCQKRLVRADDQAADDFTTAGYLCEQWSGAFGMRFGPEEGPVDKLPDELLDDIGEENPPRPGEEEPGDEAGRAVRTMQPRPEPTE